MAGRVAEPLRWSALGLIAAVLALGLLAACGDDGGEETVAPPTETTAPEEETTAPEEEEGEADGEEAEPEAGGIQVSEGDPSAGKAIFADNCAVCHGSGGTGGNVGPPLDDPQLAQEEEAVVNQIVEGGGGMPPFGDELSDQEIADVAAFVVEDVAKP